MTCNNPKLDIVNINAYIKFGENQSMCSQDIERKQNSIVFFFSLETVVRFSVKIQSTLINSKSLRPKFLLGIISSST